MPQGKEILRMDPCVFKETRSGRGKLALIIAFKMTALPFGLATHVEVYQANT